jgi:hypothetical protein
MMPVALLTRAVLLAILCALGLPVLAHAQDAAQTITVRGLVLGPDNRPLADQRVVLHRVDTSGGATIAETQSAADGSFELIAQAEPDTSALLFVAARYDEELYIGPPFRPGDITSLDQQIQVGIPAMSATAMMEQGQGPPMRVGRPATARNWMLLLIPLLGVLGVAVYALVPRSSIPEDRARLIRVAELDERLDTAPDAQREAMLQERARLMAELREG